MTIPQTDRGIYTFLQGIIFIVRIFVVKSIEKRN